MHVEDELQATLGEFLMHIGIERRSGRYPWGSGENAYQRNKSFLNYVDDLKKKGLSETQICEGMGITTTQLRAYRSMAKNEQKAADIRAVEMLKEKNMSNVAIGQRLGIPESTVRKLLEPATKAKNDELVATANMLRDQIKEKGMIDVGTGVEYQLDIPRQKLDVAISMLEDEGYNVYKFQAPQVGTDKQTNMKVIADKDVPYADVYQKQGDIQQIQAMRVDDGQSFKVIQPPLMVDPSRVEVVYAEQGGGKADGVIYVRPGAEDLSLGAGHYAQVRIGIEGDRYLKGMAIYKDDLPPGVDLQFHTTKSDTGNKLDAMKKMEIDRATGKVDQDNPFGSIVRQMATVGPDGKVKVTSAMNIVNDEDAWDKWNKNLSPQMLSKQKSSFAKEQLDITYLAKKSEYESIMQLTNPVVREKLLQSFSDGVDASAVHLKAAALPRQKTHVILPINSLSDNEIYAPNYKNGERVALIRYPHGGKFEIPELTVNNRNPEARGIIGNALTAVGINSKVAARMSGADFDGDTVLVIPNDRRKVTSTKPLDGLKDFDPQKSYPSYKGMPVMKNKQQEMGNISNLITDMTIQNATHAELARAVKHSMVVIDAEKHKLNYKQSAKDNAIAELKRKYQGGADKGASTLISRASSTERVDERVLRKARDGGPIDPKTGKLVYTETGASYIKVGKNGQPTVVTKKTTVKKGEYADDLHKLTSAYDRTGKRVSNGTPIEAIYADHGNRLKSLANQARKSMVETKYTPWSPSAKTAYSNEVASLKAKLNLAKKNAPLERQANLLAGSIVKAKKASNPDITKAEEKKLNSLALAESRARVGAKKAQVAITPKEWSAIEAGAVSTSFLKQVLTHTDLDVVKTYAMPRKATVMVPAKVARAKALLAAGYNQSEIAATLGVAVSTLNGALK